MPYRAFVATCALACSVQAHSATVTFNLAPVADTTLYFDGPTGDATSLASNARGENLSVGVTAGGEIRRGLLRFDLSGVAPGSVVVSATLTLFETRSRANYDVALHRLTTAWGEGSSNGGSAGASGTATAGDATWIASSHPGVTWSTPGGDFLPTASAVTAVGFAGASYDWSSAGLVADVQSWVNLPSANHGWILIGGEGGNQNAKLFGSRESAVGPLLVVEVSPIPEPATYMTMALGVGLIGWRLRSRQRKANARRLVLG